MAAGINLRRTSSINDFLMLYNRFWILWIWVVKGSAFRPNQCLFIFEVFTRRKTCFKIGNWHKKRQFIRSIGISRRALSFANEIDVKNKPGDASFRNHDRIPKFPVETPLVRSWSIETFYATQMVSMLIRVIAGLPQTVRIN